MTIKEAIHKLVLLKRIKTEPELILTELFSESIDDVNLLCQINIDGEYIQDFLKDRILELPIFDGCNISMYSCDEFGITIPAIKYGKYEQYKSDDVIIRVDLSEKTYQIYKGDIKEYRRAMISPQKPVEKKLDKYWERFVDLDFKKRIKFAINSIGETYVNRDGEVCRKSPFVKVSNFFFWVRCSGANRKRVDEKLQEAMESLKRSNEYNLKIYNEDILRSQYYLEYAPNHIEKIKKKQAEIAKYLNEIGYSQEVDED